MSSLKAAKIFSVLIMFAIALIAVSFVGISSTSASAVVGCNDDDVCDAGESPLWCPNDCHPEGHCGDGFCDVNEQGNCPADCESSCTPTNGGVERCDGADNDCDGKIDEGLPLICKSEPVSAALYIPDTASQSFKIIISNPDNDPLVIEWLDNGATAQTGNTSYIFSATPSSGSPHTIKATVNNTATDEYMEKEWQLNINTTFYRDADEDGFGDAADSVRAYAAPDGYVIDNTDCDDSDDAINPDATEVCNGIDDNCDSEVDEGLNETKLVGAEFQITNDTNKDGYPAIAFGEDRYLLAWSKGPDYENRNIFGRFLAADSAPIGPEFAIAQYESLQSMPTVKFNSYAQEWLVVWTDYRADADFGDLYGRIVNSNGSFVDSEFVISSEYDAQEMGAIASLPDKFLVAWTDSRAWENNTADIYAQLVAANGSLIGSEIIISNGADIEADPSLVYDPANDRVLVVWDDWRNSETTGADTYGRFIGSNGSFIGSEFAIIDETYDQQYPAVEYNPKDGTFMVVTDEFMSPTLEQRNIRAQKLSANGEKIGSTLQLNDNPLLQWIDENARIAYSPAIDKYLTLWGDNQTSADGYLDTWGQVIKNDGSLEGINFNVSNATESQSGAALAAGPGQEFLAVWGDLRAYPNSEIWGQRVQAACG